MTNLVIVESPGKKDIIKKYLNSIDELKNMGKWEVIASYGHIRDLSKKNMGINIENNFEPKYEIISNQYIQKTIKALKNGIQNSKMVWIASDADREGEAIGYHIIQTFKLNANQYKRIIFNEITKSALKNAVLNYTDIDMNMVNSQQGRRFLDRIVGFKISPLLWKRFDTGTGLSGLSAGRVQSAALNIIVNKEYAIENFATSSYYNSIGNFEFDGHFQIKDAKYSENIDTSKNAIKLLKIFINSKFHLVDVKYSNKSQNPPLPFITSSLQQTASSDLRMSIKQVMGAAQVLYEAGLITYMRTDSYTLSNQAIGCISKHIQEQFGENYLKIRNARKKQKGAQEAHECIRPTHMDKSTINESSKITGQIKRLYELIWKRTIASQMESAKYYEITISIGNDSTNGIYQGKYKIYYFDGYLKLYNNNSGNNIGNNIGSEQQFIDPSNFNIEQYIENIIQKGTKTLKMTHIICKNIWSTPPPRYNESSIVKTLEKEQIGRPSTYAGIIGKLYEKNYIEKKDVVGQEMEYVHYALENNTITENKDIRPITDEKSKLVPSNIGKQINEYMCEYFPIIVNSKFTSDMEDKLDLIANGQTDYKSVLNEFYRGFAPLIQSATEMNKIKGKQQIGDAGYSKEYKIGNDNNNNNNNNENQITTCIIRMARYGPVIELKTPTKNKNKFISLTKYMEDTKKAIEDININDINILLSLPKIIGNKDGESVTLLYGRYGFYMSWNNMNVTIFKKYIDYILTSDYDALIKLIKINSDSNNDKPPKYNMKKNKSSRYKYKK